MAKILATNFGFAPDCYTHCHSRYFVLVAGHSHVTCVAVILARLATFRATAAALAGIQEITGCNIEPWKWVCLHGLVILEGQEQLNTVPVGYSTTAVLEIPTGPPVRGRQLWRRAGNFCWFFFNFMFMIWNSRQEDLQLFDWVSNTEYQ